MIDQIYDLLPSLVRLVDLPTAVKWDELKRATHFWGYYYTCDCHINMDIIIIIIYTYIKYSIIWYVLLIDAFFIHQPHTQFVFICWEFSWLFCFVFSPHAPVVLFTILSWFFCLRARRPVQRHCIRWPIKEVRNCDSVIKECAPLSQIATKKY